MNLKCSKMATVQTCDWKTKGMNEWKSSLVGRWCQIKGRTLTSEWSVESGHLQYGRIQSDRLDITNFLKEYSHLFSKEPLTLKLFWRLMVEQHSTNTLSVLVRSEASAIAMDVQICIQINFFLRERRCCICCTERGKKLIKSEKLSSSVAFDQSLNLRT